MNEAIALIAVMVLVLLQAAFVSHGYANTLKSIALAIFEHAERFEERVEKRRAEVAGKWQEKFRLAE